MLVLKPFTKDHGRSMVHPSGDPTSQVTCASWVCHPPARIHVRLLGPCFKTGRMEALSQRGSTRRHGRFFPPGQPTLTWRCVTLWACGSAPRASIRFPLNNFKHCLTLFSKFFSPFPRGTCSLSVSCQYLALDGIYHPLRAAFPNNPTRR